MRFKQDSTENPPSFALNTTPPETDIGESMNGPGVSSRRSEPREHVPMSECSDLAPSESGYGGSPTGTVRKRPSSRSLDYRRNTVQPLAASSHRKRYN